MINRIGYNELDTIAWDVRNKYFTNDDAFSLYERRWSFVCQERLSIKERILIVHLIKTIGRGCFLPNTNEHFNLTEFEKCI